MNWNKIEQIKDLPKFGKYVLVSGVDNSTYGKRRMHVCCIDDLEDGVQYHLRGEFYWLTESGRKIEDVTHWRELPSLPDDELNISFKCPDCMADLEWDKNTNTVKFIKHN